MYHIDIDKCGQCNSKKPKQRWDIDNSTMRSARTTLGLDEEKLKKNIKSYSPFILRPNINCIFSRACYSLKNYPIFQIPSL